MKGNPVKRERPTYHPEDKLDEVIRRHLVRLHWMYEGRTTFIYEAAGISRRRLFRYRDRWPELKEF